MRQKTLLLAVLGSALLVSAGVAGALMLGSGSASASQPDRSQKSISVSADGEIEATPDQAVVRVAILATGEDSTTVREELATDAESMRTALEEYGLDSEDVRTAHYDIRQERERTPEGTEMGDYRGVHAFEITLDDTDAAGEVVDVAVENGADQVNGVSFTLSDDTREELHNEALTEAMSNARDRADTLAAAGDLSVTEVHTIVSTETRYHDYRVETAYASAAGDSTSIEAGAVTVTANVRVTYNATTA
ncbi:SIMPL domain-containing protein [Halobacterium wangiae]|uniref:SIMPL domain-containing protein n=1 Tax=Halobacterium wangiae TaxID=2902623 RepID=UPI001E45F69A|nr:SIMPL domain-containing protein [Halobacterium wangiae]